MRPTCSTHTWPPNSPSNSCRCYCWVSAEHSIAAEAAAGSSRLAEAPGGNPDLAGTLAGSPGLVGSLDLAGNLGCNRRILVVGTGVVEEARSPWKIARGSLAQGPGSCRCSS